MRFILKREGYGVISAEDGSECLEKIEKEKPDMVFLDITMPGMNGWGVCREIKRGNPSLPVAICSARGNEDDIERSLKYAGADEHITKPFSFSKILDTVRSF